MKSILDPTFRYIPSFDTDLRRTFARIRRERTQDGRRSAPTVERNLDVTRIVSLAGVSQLPTPATARRR